MACFLIQELSRSFHHFSHLILIRILCYDKKITYQHLQLVYKINPGHLKQSTTIIDKTVL